MNHFSKLCIFVATLKSSWPTTQLSRLICAQRLCRSVATTYEMLNSIVGMRGLLPTNTGNLISGTVPRGGGRKGGTNTAIPHMVAREYRNTASKFSQIPKPQLQMGKSWRCQYYKSSFQIEIILLCQCFQIMVRRCQAYDKHKIIALV